MVSEYTVTQYDKILATLLIEEVFAPLIVALGQQSHEVPAGVQAERPGCSRQLEPGFLGRTAALAIVARMAAGHKILPSGFAGARARDHVIESEFAGGHGPVTILAGVAVAHQDIFARKSARLVRNAAVLEQADP